MIKNFISDIINSANHVVISTGDAVDKIVSISNPLAKRENESSEDYQIRLEHLERQKEINLQSKSDRQKAKLERTKVKAELQREQKQIKLEHQQLKQETKQVRVTERTKTREMRRQAKLERQQLKQEAKLQLIK